MRPFATAWIEREKAEVRLENGVRRVERALGCASHAERRVAREERAAPGAIEAARREREVAADSQVAIDGKVPGLVDIDAAVGRRQIAASDAKLFDVTRVGP